MAISRGNVSSMNNYGFYCQKMKRYDDAEKFYKLAIMNNNVMAMYNLGYYYQCIEKNYIKM